MIAYLDASAVVKRYVSERGSRETIELSSRAEVVATSILSRVEVGAALAKGARLGLLSAAAARKARRAFVGEWMDYARVAVSEALVGQAEDLAWEHGLRGYDAMHLASALTWYQSIDAGVVFATFDRRLWEAAGKAGLSRWPAELAS